MEYIQLELVILIGMIIYGNLCLNELGFVMAKKSCAIVAHIPLGKPEWLRVCRDTKFTDKPILGSIRNAKDVWNSVKDRSSSEEQEVFYVIILDSQVNVLGISEVARGTANNLAVHLRDIFRAAILMGAVYIIVAHNHPSGRLDPSESDIELTRQSVKAGELLGVKVLDHLIVTTKGYYSFEEAGFIEEDESYCANC